MERGILRQRRQISFQDWSIGKLISFDFKYPILKLQLLSLFEKSLFEMRTGKREIGLYTVDAILGFFSKLHSNLLKNEVWSLFVGLIGKEDEKAVKLLKTLPGFNVS